MGRGRESGADGATPVQGGRVAMHCIALGVIEGIEGCCPGCQAGGKTFKHIMVFCNDMATLQ